MFRNLFMTCPDVALKLGDSVRVVEHWVKGFEDNGFSALSDKPRPGRPTRLTEKHLTKISGILRKQPKDVGLSGNLWDGKTLSAWIHQQYRVQLKTRQCQRMFRYLGFRLRKPRPMIAQADPQLHQTHKKTPAHDEES